MKFRGFLFLLFISFTFLQCRKNEGDKRAPVITIYEPSNDAHFRALDTVLILGSVRDENKITRINIALFDGSNNKALPSVDLSPKTTEYQLNVKYVLNDLHLEAGSYYFNISAYDEEGNFDVSYLGVNMSSYPVESKGIFALTADGATVRIYQLQGEDLQLFKQLSGDYRASAINSFDQQLYIMGRHTGDLRAIDLATANEVWSRKASGSSAVPYFQSMSFNDRTLYYGLYSGDVEGVDHAGVGIYDGSARPGNVSEIFLKYGDKLVAVERNTTAKTYFLVVYQHVSGTEVHHLQLTEQAVALFPRKGSQLLFFGNGNGEQWIRTYNVSGNYFEFKAEKLSGDSIRTVIQAEESSYLMAKGNEIIKYSTAGISITPLVSGVEATSLAYDRVNRLVYAVVAGQVRVYHYENGTLLMAIDGPADIAAVHVLYNK